MHREKYNSGVLSLFGAGILYLAGAASFTLAQQAPNNTLLDSFLGNARISGYKKISVNLPKASIHVVGPETTIVVTEKAGQMTHRLHADDIQLRKDKGAAVADLSGNVGYTATQTVKGAKIFECTAQSASYRQPAAKDDATIVLHNAQASLFRDGSLAAAVTAKQLTARLQDQSVTAVGDVRITAVIEEHQATVTANRVTWSRQTNVLAASGDVHITYEAQGGKESSTHGNRITVDLNSQTLDIE